jgi:hypothetical protein
MHGSLEICCATGAAMQRNRDTGRASGRGELDWPACRLASWSSSNSSCWSRTAGEGGERERQVASFNCLNVR